MPNVAQIKVSLAFLIMVGLPAETRNSNPPKINIKRAKISTAAKAICITLNITVRRLTGSPFSSPSGLGREGPFARAVLERSDDETSKTEVKMITVKIFFLFLVILVYINDNLEILGTFNKARAGLYFPVITMISAVKFIDVINTCPWFTHGFVGATTVTVT